MGKPEKESHKLKILIVDDVPNMRKTLRRMLSSIGYKDVLEADDGDTALVQIRTNPVDMVIADWIMPRMPGVELLAQVRDDPRMRDMPFIIITGETEEAQIVRAAEEDVDGYIIKPFIAKIFEKKIRSVLEKKANPPPVEVHIKMGMVLADNGMFEEAVGELEKAMGIRPNSARIQLALARVCEKMGEIKNAERCVRSAMTLNPRYIKAYDHLAEILMKKGDEDAAVETLIAVSKISPNNPKRLVVIGRHQLKRGNLEEAKNSFRAAVSNAMRDKNMFGEIGEAYLASGQEEMAIEAFQESLNLLEDVHIYNRLGIALRRKERYEEAIENYKKALLINQNDEVLHFNIGLAYQEYGQMELAISELKTALKLDPNFKECQEALKNITSGSNVRERGDSGLSWYDSSDSAPLDYNSYGPGQGLRR